MFRILCRVAYLVCATSFSNDQGCRPCHTGLFWSGLVCVGKETRMYVCIYPYMGGQWPPSVAGEKVAPDEEARGKRHQHFSIGISYLQRGWGQGQVAGGSWVVVWHIQSAKWRARLQCNSTNNNNNNNNMIATRRCKARVPANVDQGKQNSRRIHVAWQRRSLCRYVCVCISVWVCVCGNISLSHSANASPVSALLFHTLIFKFRIFKNIFKLFSKISLPPLVLFFYFKLFKNYI